MIQFVFLRSDLTRKRLRKRQYFKCKVLRRSSPSDRIPMRFCFSTWHKIQTPSVRYISPVQGSLYSPPNKVAIPSAFILLHSLAKRCFSLPRFCRVVSSLVRSCDRCFSVSLSLSLRFFLESTQLYLPRITVAGRGSYVAWHQTASASERSRRIGGGKSDKRIATYRKKNAPTWLRRSRKNEPGELLSLQPVKDIAELAVVTRCRSVPLDPLQFQFLQLWFVSVKMK